MTTPPSVTLQRVIFEPEGTVLSCPTCAADKELQMRGVLGDPVTITCPDGHPVPLPDYVDHADFFMQVAGEPGVDLVLPSE